MDSVIITENVIILSRKSYLLTLSAFLASKLANHLVTEMGNKLQEPIQKVGDTNLVSHAPSRPGEITY